MIKSCFLNQKGKNSCFLNKIYFIILLFLLFRCSSALFLEPIKFNGKYNRIFGWNSSHYCGINFKNNKIDVFISDKNNNYKFLFERMIPNNYCEIQGCLNFKNQMHLLCKVENTGEIILLGDKRIFLNKTGIFARIDYLDHKKMTIYDGSFITMYTINSTKLKEKSKFAFKYDITDLLYVDSKLFVIFSKFVYNPKNMSFCWFESTDYFETLLFPNEYKINENTWFLWFSIIIFMCVFTIYLRKTTNLSKNFKQIRVFN